MFGKLRWSSSAGEGTERTFTGHVYDSEAELFYMGARHYDPEIGTFLTFDPARQFASPYTYAGNNPMGGVDPTGAEFITTTALIVAALSAAVTFVETLSRGGDLGAALNAAAGAGAMAAIGSPQGIVINAVANAAAAHVVLSQAIAAASLLYRGYGVATSIRNGNVASGILSAALLAADGLRRTRGSAENAPGASSGEAPRVLSDAELDAKESAKPVRVSQSWDGDTMILRARIGFGGEETSDAWQAGLVAGAEARWSGTFDGVKVRSDIH